MPNKNAALARVKQERPVLMRFGALGMLALHYHQKSIKSQNRIKIIEAGQTPIGRTLITIDRVKRLKKILEVVESRKNYAAFILEIGWTQFAFVQTPAERIYIHDITNLLTIIKETKLDDCFYTWTAPEEKKRIVDHFNEMICIDQSLRQQLDDIISFWLANEFNTLDSIRLSGGINVFFEINYLRWKLVADASLGYVIANDAEHVDHYLISKGRVIIPLVYDSQPYFGIDAYSDLLSGCGHLYMRSNGLPVSCPGFPQATGTNVCGTVAFLYLKELLKNEAQQLNEYSLCFSCYFANDNKLNCYFPAPQILRYSQSRVYVEIAKLMMQSDEPEERFVLKGDSEVVITPLKELLRQSIQYAVTNGDHRTIGENTEILNRLDELRVKWLRAYEDAMKSRHAMNDADSGHNMYLTYSSLRYDDKVKKRLASIDGRPRSTNQYTTVSELATAIRTKTDDLTLGLKNTFDALLRLLDSAIKTCDNDSMLSHVKAIYQHLYQRLLADNDIPDDANFLVPAIYAIVGLLTLEDDNNKKEFQEYFDFLVVKQTDKTLKKHMRALYDAYFHLEPSVFRP